MLLPLFISALLAISAYAVDERQEAFIGYKEDSADFEFVLTLDRGLGKIRIQPRRDISPRIVRLIHDLAAKGACSHCKFYRHEPVAAVRQMRTGTGTDTRTHTHTQAQDVRLTRRVRRHYLLTRRTSSSYPFIVRWSLPCDVL